MPVQRSRGMGGEGNFSMRPVVICFPPMPPPLDRPITHVVSSLPPRFTPPADLAADINEPFYAPLSTWLLERALSDKMRDRINALHTAKANALSELHAALEQTRDVDQAARQRALVALAQQQKFQLVTLEREAEQIRDDLAIGNYDWRALREWSLGENNRRGDSPMEIAATLRAYAYYQSGISDAQRRLLREISLELAVAGEDTAAAEAAQPFLFFSPEPARVLLPDDLPADLAARVAAYQTKKSAVKKELYDTVYQQDNAAVFFLRNNALKSLAVKQARALAELETLAEDIRRGLAALPSATHPVSEHSPLPPVLAERFNAVVRQGATLQKETIASIDAVRAAARNEPIQLNYSFDSSGLKYEVFARPNRATSAGDANAQVQRITPRVQAIEARMSEIADYFGRRYAELLNEANAIRADAAAALGNVNSRAIEAALTEAHRIATLKDSEAAYRDYRLAVFEPGLSPEQRRLLFGGAIVELNLPLPRGEYQPARRAAGW